MDTKPTNGSFVQHHIFSHTISLYVMVDISSNVRFIPDSPQPYIMSIFPIHNRTTTPCTARVPFWSWE
jgi:hypothetical protein